MTPKRVTVPTSRAAQVSLSEIVPRIGPNERKNGNWLLRFVQRDLRKLEKADWLSLIQEVTAFAYLASGLSPKDRAKLKVGADLELMTASMDFKDGGPLRYCYPTPEHVRGLQAEMRRAIEELLTIGRTVLPPVRTTFEIQRSERGTPARSRRDTGLFYFFPPRADADEILAAFQMRCAKVLVEVSDYLRQCPASGRSRGCLGLFLATRQHKTFCRPKCGSVLRGSRYRERQREMKRKAEKTNRKLKGGMTHGTKRRQGSRHR